MPSIRPLAFYLPQFHPIPENDRWWGKGFTEWTNVTKAKPLFEGHWQPRLPADLGFYDLRLPEVRNAQAMLAKKYGIEGFCYWHYWFAGKRVIERPFHEVVKSGKPDFPFCIAWANQTWQGTWHGLSNNKILIEQTYPGKRDDTEHFYSLLEAFNDKRYIEVNDKKLIFIFRPMEIPNPNAFIELWQNLAAKEGLNGLHFVGMHMPQNWRPQMHGFDAMIPDFLARYKYKKFMGDQLEITPVNRLRRKLFRSMSKALQGFKSLPEIVSYKKYVNHFPEYPHKQNEYPWIYPNWDNTPRAEANGWLFEDSTPELFGDLCMKAFKETENKKPDEKIVIIKSWNEWAEGNYLEPDHRFGTAYLEQLRSRLHFYKNHPQII